MTTTVKRHGKRRDRSERSGTNNAAAFWATLLAACLLGSGTGCGQKYPKLTFTSLNEPKVLVQPYALGAMARDGRGDWDLVLVSQGLERERSLTDRLGSAVNPIRLFRYEKEAGQDLTPTVETPIRQVVHIKLHWRPSSGAKPDNPAAANATVRWLLFGPSEAAGTPEYIEYQGLAFVRPTFRRRGFDVAIREGTLEPVARTGEMIDVLGPTRMEGNFYLDNDPNTVGNVLGDLPPGPVRPLPRTLRPATTLPTTRSVVQ